MGLIQLSLVAALLLWIPWILGRRGVLVAAACGAASLLFESGQGFGVMLGGVWMLGCCAIAALALRQTLLWGHDHLGHLLNGIASVFLVGGAVWLLSSRFNTDFLGFGEPWKTLTAIHFHYSGFLLTSILALHWSQNRSRAYNFAALIYIMSFILVAVGLTGSRAFELAGVTLLFGAIVASGWIVLRGQRSILTGTIGLVGFVSFTAALLYSWRIRPELDLPTMIATHGLLNAFLLMPLLIFFSKRTAKPLPIRQIPFSRLKSLWAVGAHFFDPLVAGDETKVGLLDNFDEFARPEFDSKSVNLNVRLFYERTADYDLFVKAQPQAGFKFVWRWLAKPFFSSIQQLNLPDREKHIRGTIHALRAQLDGRTSPRGWMRTDLSTGRSIYAAAYSMHQSRGITYMNIAFPLPASNMTSVLHIEHLENFNGGIRLTTLKNQNPFGDQGVYLVTGLGRGRLPLDETIEVWFDGELKARHQMWFCGLHYLTLYYEIRGKTS